MGGIDPFGDIMGTSAGPAREEEKNYLFNQAARAKVNSHLHSSINSTHAGTQTGPHTLRAEPGESVTQTYKTLLLNGPHSTESTSMIT